MKARILITSLPLVLMVLAPGAHAERDRFAIDNPTYRAECASCHVAYPPALLPAETWRQLMRGLDKHFGSDASADAATAAAVERYLVANAGRPSKTSNPALRITRTPWFLSEHDEVSAAIWKRKSVGSPSNCGACHTRADQGSYGEHNVRIPK